MVFIMLKKIFQQEIGLKFAIKKINEIQKKKKNSNFVGGTGLYFKALTDGLVKIPNIPIRFRNKIRSLQKV